jgi:hypothetical protein
VNGYEVTARRRARQIVQDMRWHGMTVPPLYTQMAEEFQELVHSGEYADWVARPRPSRPRTPRVTSGPQPMWRMSQASRAVRPLTAGLIRERVGSEG